VAANARERHASSMKRERNSINISIVRRKQSATPTEVGGHIRVYIDLKSMMY
jgi:hypothetical protein